MLRAMSAAGLVLVLVAAWAVGLPAAENEKSEAAAKAAEAFESLFGKEFKQVRMTADVRDDIDLAKRLIAAAKEAKDQPEFVAVLCEKACELASVPAGYATAAEALQLLAASVPEKSAACAARLIEIRQRQYDAAKGEDRAKAGETLLDVLLAAADAKEKEGATVEPAALLKRAVFVATAVKSDRRTEIETHLKAMEQTAKTLREIEDLKKQLEADPQKVAAREKLVRLLLVDRDDPAEAAKWVEGAEDAALKKYVPAAAKPLPEAPDLACKELGDWYRDLADQGATPAVKGAMLRRAWAYYQRFMDVHTGDDLATATGRLTLKKIEEDLAKLGPAAGKPGTQGVWVDCLALVDPAKDAVRGAWERRGEAVRLSRPDDWARIQVPVVLSGNYEMRVKLMRASGDDGVCVQLPVGAATVELALGPWTNSGCGLTKVNGKDRNETTVPVGIDNGREYDLNIKVALDGDAAEITVTRDGKPFIHWRGPVSALTTPQGFEMPTAGCPALMAWQSVLVCRDMQVRMISGEAKLLRPGDKPAVPAKTVSAEKPEPKEKPVKEKPSKEKAGKDKEPKWLDVLAFVDPVKDKIEGTWRRTDAGLAMEDAASSGLLAIPVAPKGSYEFQARFTRTAGDDTIAIVLPAGPKAVGVLLSYWHGLASGLGNIKGEDPKANETRVRPGGIENNVEHTVYAKVVAGTGMAEITATLDDKPLVNWKGPTNDLSVFFCFELPKPECLGLGISNSKIIWHSAELRMLSGDVKPMRPLAKPAAK